MGAVEICIGEDGALKVVQRFDLRPVLKRMRPEGFERHRVFTWPTCSVERPDSCCGSGDDEEAKFNRRLKVAFTFLLCMCAGSLVYYEQLLSYELWYGDNILIGALLSRCFEVGPNGILILAIFAAVLAAGVLAKYVTEKACSAPPRKEEVQTVSALVQQV